MPSSVLSLALAVTGFLSTGLAHPTVEKRGAALPDNFEDGTHDYTPQQPGDRRSPCPGLNTLANHGYLPRNGKGITRNALSQAFSQGFGIAQSVISTPTENAFAVCEYRNGKGACPYTFDLDDLNTSDTLEHDHSLSRQDDRELYAVNSDGSYNKLNSFVFNRTRFGTTLMNLKNSPIMGINDAEQVRLTREHIQYTSDPLDTFKENRATWLTEMGFVFAVMRNFNNSIGYIAKQTPNDASYNYVFVDWWSYWFSRQQFPTELGWRKPVPDVENAYVQSVSSSVFHATASSTPSPLPPDATKEPTKVPLFASTNNKKRHADPTPASAVEPRAAITNGPLGVALGGVACGVAHINEYVASQIRSIVGPSPPPLLNYEIKYSYDDIVYYQSELSSHRSAFQSVAASLLGAATPAAVQARATEAPEMVAAS